MPNMLYCHECKTYAEPVDRPVKAAADGTGFVDTDNSQIGLGRTTIRRCPKGHMLNIGTPSGFHGDLLQR